MKDLLIHSKNLGKFKNQKENKESFEKKETTKKSSWDSSPLVPEVDEIPY